MAAPHQVVTKPKVLTGRSLAVDSKELFTALAKGVMHSFLGKWEEVASDSIDAIKSLGISTEPPAIAYILIRRAAMNAMFELIGETVKAGFFGSVPYTSMHEESLDYSITEHDIPINKTFFEKPTELEVVKSLQKLLGRWLVALGIQTHLVNAITDRFPSYYLYALNEEWKQHNKLYEPLLSSIDTPFTNASDREWAWHSYASLLQRTINESTFEEAFSLSQIYVPLRAYYELPTTSKLDAEAIDKRPKPKKIVELAEELSTWLGNGSKDDAIRIITGGPGSGKSSFAKIFAAHISNNHNIKVLFIPLHRFDATNGLTEAVGNFVAEESILPHNPLSTTAGDSNLLIIFDGLDELASQGKAAVDTARAFVREVDLTLEKRNSQVLKLRVIISGREIVLQDNEMEFGSRRPHQMLILLPYYIEKNSLVGAISDPRKLLGQDQRHDWWRQYGKLTGKSYAGLPKHLDRPDLHEVTSQPLLNYLVALSYTRGKLDFTKDVNLNEIYADLVEAVHARAYEKKRRYAQIEGMSLENFVRVLEEVGLAAWHGDGRTTTVREIEEHCTTSGMDRHLKAFEEDAKAGVIRLLAAFFFRQYGRRSTTGDATFMFTHKSFGEYLTARRIVRALEKITKERADRKENPDDGWDERESLKQWAQIAGPSPMTPYLASFIQDEVRLRKPSAVLRIQLCLTELFSVILRNGTPMELLAIPTFKEATFRARNAEEALLVCMSACARKTHKISPVVHPDPLAFGLWFRRIQGQRKGPKSALAAAHLDYINLSKVGLDIIDFYGVNLSFSNLSGSQLHYSTLIDATLMETNCKGIIALGAVFSHADIHGTNLTGARLDGANLKFAQITDAKLDRARILKRQDLLDANISPNTDISKVRFAEDERDVSKTNRNESTQTEEQLVGKS